MYIDENLPPPLYLILWNALECTYKQQDVSGWWQSCWNHTFTTKYSVTDTVYDTCYWLLFGCLDWMLKKTQKITIFVVLQNIQVSCQYRWKRHWGTPFWGPRVVEPSVPKPVGWNRRWILMDFNGFQGPFLKGVEMKEWWPGTFSKKTFANCRILICYTLVSYSWYWRAVFFNLLSMDA